ncbi:glucose-6-phosphate dehydrogenase [Aureimonas sp. AU12]|uniref:glucose-6-phosphate dehydrogenase n=1 Tax=Aureimonas sp. AU12 TaxID=1638161 RepID=UPI00078350C6|nr:glucose-6-phosphate dehydrogenase [Aureimonas sp. AU12]
MTQPLAPATAGSTAPPCTLVIFGAAGDLTKRLLVPSLYDLASAGLIDGSMRVLGVDRADLDDQAFADGIGRSLHELAADPGAEFNAGTIRDEIWNPLRSRFSYLRGDITDPATFEALGARISGSAVFYCAVSSRFFLPIASRLGHAGLLREKDGAFRRLVVEKPFGNDLASARALDAALLALANESQIYRIDHFLGKETVQAIMALRFANRIFEPVWSGEHIDHVEITAAETLGVEGRGGFYEQAGALRDMVPNHLFQLLSMVAMEPPESFEQTQVRDAKAKLLAAVRPVEPGDAVRGQYGAGTLNGAARVAYRAEPNVAPDSTTETYAALKLTIDTPRWAGVPFYLRSGKRMSAHRTEVVVTFRAPSHPLFSGANGAAPAPNRLILEIDGEKGVRTRFQTKRPGPGLVLAPVVETFRHEDFFQRTPNVGYETLLHACMSGDATLFQRADSIEAAWAVVEPLIEAWGKGSPEIYAAGSDGPEGADALLARDGHRWTALGDDPDARVDGNPAARPAA